MDVDGEVGGNDQTFNMLVWRTLMKEISNKEKEIEVIEEKEIEVIEEIPIDPTKPRTESELIAIEEKLVEQVETFEEIEEELK